MPQRLRVSVGNVIAGALIADGYPGDNLTQLWRMMDLRRSPGHDLRYDSPEEVVPKQRWITAVTYVMMELRAAMQRQCMAIQIGATCRAAYIALTSQHDFDGGLLCPSVHSCCGLHAPGYRVNFLVQASQ